MSKHILQVKGVNNEATVSEDILIQRVALIFHWLLS
jgi:hypothetical protein